MSPLVGRGPLVDAAQLAVLCEDPKTVVVDVRHQLGAPAWGREQYRAGHIPGAHFVDVETELSGPVGDGRRGRHPLPEATDFEAVMRRCGIEQNSVVVALDQGDNLAAARLWWLLRHHGHQQVLVLDGGMEAWRRAGGGLTTVEPPSGAGSFTAVPGHLPVVGSDALPDLQARGHQLFDVRAPQRFRGELEPIDPLAGHIPGARNLPASLLAGAQGGFGMPEQLREVLAPAQAGDVLSCGSGLTASQVVLAASSIGLDGLVLHAGSWSEWISDPDRPIRTGT